MKTATLRGPVRLEQLIDVIRSQGALPGLPLKLLVDMTHAHLSAEPDEVRMLARTLVPVGQRSLNPGKIIPRVSIITRDASTFGYLRMFEAYADGAGVDFHVCRDDASASHWLDSAEIRPMARPSDPDYHGAPRHCSSQITPS